MIPDATSNQLWILWIARAICTFLRLWHVTDLGPRTICWEIVSLLVMLGRYLVYWCIVPFTWIVHNLFDGSNLHDAWCYTHVYIIYIYIYIYTHIILQILTPAPISPTSTVGHAVAPSPRLVPHKGRAERSEWCSKVALDTWNFSRWKGAPWDRRVAQAMQMGRH